MVLEASRNAERDAQTQVEKLAQPLANDPRVMQSINVIRHFTRTDKSEDSRQWATTASEQYGEPRCVREASASYRHHGHTLDQFAGECGTVGQGSHDCEQNGALASPREFLVYPELCGGKPVATGWIGSETVIPVPPVCIVLCVRSRNWRANTRFPGQSFIHVSPESFMGLRRGSVPVVGLAKARMIIGTEEGLDVGNTGAPKDCVGDHRSSCLRWSRPALAVEFASPCEGDHGCRDWSGPVIARMEASFVAGTDEPVGESQGSCDSGNSGAAAGTMLAADASEQCDHAGEYFVDNRKLIRSRLRQRPGYRARLQARSLPTHRCGRRSTAPVSAVCVAKLRRDRRQCRSCNQPRRRGVPSGMETAVVHDRIPQCLLPPVVQSPRRYRAAVPVCEHVKISFPAPCFTGALLGGLLSFLRSPQNGQYRGRQFQ